MTPPCRCGVCGEPKLLTVHREPIQQRTKIDCLRCGGTTIVADLTFDKAVWGKMRTHELHDEL